MSPLSILLILVSVLLSASAQLFMKAGMSTETVKGALGADGSLPAAVFAVALSPMVIAGLFCFGLSAVTWLLVLSKVDVSQAYPFVALGIVITAVGGYIVLGEPLVVLRIVGISTVVVGVLIVAMS